MYEYGFPSLKDSGQRCTCVLMVDKTFNPNSNAIVYLMYPLKPTVEPSLEDVQRV